MQFTNSTNQKSGFANAKNLSNFTFGKDLSTNQVLATPAAYDLHCTTNKRGHVSVSRLFRNTSSNQANQDLQTKNCNLEKPYQDSIMILKNMTNFQQNQINGSTQNKEHAAGGKSAVPKLDMAFVNVLRSDEKQCKIDKQRQKTISFDKTPLKAARSNDRSPVPVFNRKKSPTMLSKAASKENAAASNLNQIGLAKFRDIKTQQNLKRANVFQGAKEQDQQSNVEIPTQRTMKIFKSTSPHTNIVNKENIKENNHLKLTKKKSSNITNKMTQGYTSVCSNKAVRIQNSDPDWKNRSEFLPYNRATSNTTRSPVPSQTQLTMDKWVKKYATVKEGAYCLLENHKKLKDQIIQMGVLTSNMLKDSETSQTELRKKVFQASSWTKGMQTQCNKVDLGLKSICFQKEFVKNNDHSQTPSFFQEHSTLSGTTEVYQRNSNVSGTTEIFQENQSNVSGTTEVMNLSGSEHAAFGISDIQPTHLNAIHIEELIDEENSFHVDSDNQEIDCKQRQMFLASETTYEAQQLLMKFGEQVKIILQMQNNLFQKTEDQKHFLDLAQDLTSELKSLPMKKIQSLLQTFSVVPVKTICDPDLQKKEEQIYQTNLVKTLQQENLKKQLSGQFKTQQNFDKPQNFTQACEKVSNKALSEVSQDSLKPIYKAPVAVSSQIASKVADDDDDLLDQDSENNNNNSPAQQIPQTTTSKKNVDLIQSPLSVELISGQIIDQDFSSFEIHEESIKLQIPKEFLVEEKIQPMIVGLEGNQVPLVPYQETTEQEVFPIELKSVSPKFCSESINETPMRNFSPAINEQEEFTLLTEHSVCESSNIKKVVLPVETTETTDTTIEQTQVEEVKVLSAQVEEVKVMSAQVEEVKVMDAQQIQQLEEARYIVEVPKIQGQNVLFSQRPDKLFKLLVQNKIKICYCLEKNICKVSVERADFKQFSTLANKSYNKVKNKFIVEKVIALER